MNLKIFVITHKECIIPSIDGYVPLLVGAESKCELRNKYICDNTGQNISHLNDSYCEMTGLYWIWKNVDTEYIGLVHYRRFFAEVDYILKYNSIYFVKSKSKLPD